MLAPSCDDMAEEAELPKERLDPEKKGSKIENNIDKVTGPKAL